MTDLVERLREVGRDGVWKSGRNPKTAHPMCIKAADRIEQLEAEVKTALHREAETTARYDAKIDALEAENERLREALELADAALSGANMNMNVVERKVRAALGDTKCTASPEA